MEEKAFWEGAFRLTLIPKCIFLHVINLSRLVDCLHKKSIWYQEYQEYYSWCVQ